VNKWLLLLCSSLVVGCLVGLGSMVGDGDDHVSKRGNGTNEEGKDDEIHGEEGDFCLYSYADSQSVLLLLLYTRERERESEKMITFEEEGIPFVRVVVACLTVLWACHDPMGKQSGMERIPGSQGSSRPSSLLLH
jgi:hypothetical protein